MKLPTQIPSEMNAIGSSQIDVRYRLGRDTHLLIHDRQARLIELGRGGFFALDSIGTRMLEIALKGGSTQVVAAMTRDYGIPSAQIAKDWSQLERILVAKGLLIAIERAAASKRIPGSAKLFLLLTLAWLSVRLLGWSASVRLWSRGQKRQCDPNANPDGIAAALQQALRSTASGHLLNPQCKEQSLVAWRVLRNQFGLPAELVVGAIPFPFQAHVWVECGACIASDDRSNCTVFTPVTRYR